MADQRILLRPLRSHSAKVSKVCSQSCWNAVSQLALRLMRPVHAGCINLPSEMTQLLSSDSNMRNLLRSPLASGTGPSGKDEKSVGKKTGHPCKGCKVAAHHRRQAKRTVLMHADSSEPAERPHSTHAGELTGTSSELATKIISAFS